MSRKKFTDIFYKLFFAVSVYHRRLNSYEQSTMCCKNLLVLKSEVKGCTLPQRAVFFSCRAAKAVRLPDV